MSIRTERVAALLKADLGEILQLDYQHDAILTVTNVRISPDLMQAHVYLSILSTHGDVEQNFELIREKTVEIRKKLAGRIRHQVRRIPELHFHLDDTADYVEKIDSLFRKIESDRKAAPSGDDDSRRDGDDSSDSDPKPGSSARKA
ncbi:30S ribosome-binding factor RbfA [Balneolales bacterium ANBcel1]|nr:30S ribosome-binding factor RbfA [Balneolales bacterium ANBcel1]